MAEDLVIGVLNETYIWISKNGNSFELCSIVNFILGCRF